MVETYFSIPETIEQALETLTGFYSQSLPEIKAMSEEEFKASFHYSAGMFIRSTWYLCWYEGQHYEHCPRCKPVLVKYFNDLGVKHPDDMSGILMTCFYRSAHNLTLDIEGQVKVYK